MRGGGARRLATLAVASAVIAAAACSGSNDDIAVSDTPDMDAVATVPSSSTTNSTVAGGVAVTGADAPPDNGGTVAATSAAATVADADGTVPATPGTLPAGDPQPDFDVGDDLPPLPPQPVIDACTRLEPFSTADVIGAAAGTAADVESIWDGACRFTAGSVVAEVHFVPELVIESDWFVRSGIEPVGSVGGDAVGLAGFSAPGSTPAGGYTIALVSRREGVIVAVRGAGDDRLTAQQLAIIADEAV